MEVKKEGGSVGFCGKNRGEEGYRMEHTCRNVICCLQKTIEELAEEGGGGHGVFDHGRPDTRGRTSRPTSTKDFLA